MQYREPLPLYHSWPLFEAEQRLGADAMAGLATFGVGLWDCDLATERLQWTDAVHDLFGLPRGLDVPRSLAVSLYLPSSRRAMESLRAHAIRHRRGFTVDAEIRRPDGDRRWMRLSAIPVLSDGRVVRLRGTKEDVSLEYDSPPVRPVPTARLWL